jgi:hypothetical protein
MGSCCSPAQSSRSKPRPTEQLAHLGERFASMRLRLTAKVFRGRRDSHQQILPAAIWTLS